MDTLFPVSGGVSVANVVVEDARPQDMAAVQAIYAPHVLQGLATFEEQPPSVDEMARRHEADDGDVLVEQFGASDELLAGDDDVVGGMQPDRQ